MSSSVDGTASPSGSLLKVDTLNSFGGLVWGRSGGASADGSWILSYDFTGFAWGRNCTAGRDG